VFWGTASPSYANHLPKILPQDLQPFGRSGDDFGEVFLRVRDFHRCSSIDRPRVSGADRSADHLDRTIVFRLEASFVLRTVRACLPDNPPLPWQTVRGS
jgi:hypothetical protein